MPGKNVNGFLYLLQVKLDCGPAFPCTHPLSAGHRYGWSSYAKWMNHPVFLDLKKGTLQYICHCQNHCHKLLTCLVFYTQSTSTVASGQVNQREFLSQTVIVIPAIFRLFTIKSLFKMLDLGQPPKLSTFKIFPPNICKSVCQAKKRIPKISAVFMLQISVRGYL